jgi:hypothetical protein
MLDSPIEFKPNTSINVPIYCPKYSIGDVVYLQNEHNKLGIYLKIINYTLIFSEFSYSDGTVQIPQLISGTYFCQLMPGSYGDISKICTDGILVGYLIMNILLIDEKATFVVQTTNNYVLYDFRMLVTEINQIKDSERANSASLLDLTTKQ